MRRLNGRSLVILTVGALVILGLVRGAGAAGPAAVKPVSFAKDIAPLLLEKCQGCHGAEKSKSNYRVDTFDRLLTAGKSKEAPITPGEPGRSNLLRLISTTDEDDRMPQKGDPLPKAQIQLVQRWIQEGARFDGAEKSAPIAALVEDREHPDAPRVYRQPVPITAMAFAPDGKELAVGGYHEITLWNPADGTLVGRIGKQAERMNGLAYSPDGRWLAAAGGAPGTFGELRLCDAVHRSAGKVLERAGDALLAVRFSPDGAQIAAGGADNAIRLFDVKKLKRQQLIEQHADWIMDLAYSPDGKLLASASRDKSARVFDVKTGAMRAAFLGHEEPLFGVAWSADGKSAITSGRDKRVRIWAAADAKQSAELRGFTAEPFRLEVGMGMLFTTCADGVVRQFSLSNNDLVRAYPKAPDWVYSIAVDGKHHRLATGCYDGQVRIYNVDDGALITQFYAAPGYGPSKP